MFDSCEPPCAICAAHATLSVSGHEQANVPDQPDASDGDYAGVEDALVRGVRAAKRASRRARQRDIEVGFNVAAEAPVGFGAACARAGPSVRTSRGLGRH